MAIALLTWNTAHAERPQLQAPVAQLPGGTLVCADMHYIHVVKILSRTEGAKSVVITDSGVSITWGSGHKTNISKTYCNFVPDRQ